MAFFFIGIYRYFHQHKWAFWSFILLCIFFILLFAGRIKLEADISGSSGPDAGKDKTGYVISHFRFSDKLVITISASGNTGKNDPSLLSSFAVDFSDSLSKQFDSSYIRSITGNIADTSAGFYYKLILDHLPVYLDSNDYRRIDTLITAGEVTNSLKRNYRILLTPAGFILKKMILNDPAGITGPALEKLHSLQADDHFDIVDGFVMTKDRAHLLIFITPANPPSETYRNTELLRGIDRLFAELTHKYQNRVKGEYFGAIAVAGSNAGQVKKDILLTLSIAIFLIFLLTGWYFKSIRIPLLSFLPALFGGGTALAILYLAKGHISVIALGVGSVILGLIVDYALYIINHFRKKGDIEIVIREMSQTIVICFLTSAGAFMCLVFLRSTVLHDLGWFAVISLTGAAFFALVILPHLLIQKDALTPDKQRTTFINRISSVSFEKKPILVVILGAIGFFSFFFAGKAGFESDMNSLNWMSKDLRQAEKNLDRIMDLSLKNVYIVTTGEDLEDALRLQERITGKINMLKNKGLITRLSGTGNLLLSDSLQQQRIRQWNHFWTVEKKQKLKETLLIKGRELKFRDAAFEPFFSLLDRDFKPLNRAETGKIAGGMLSDWINHSGKMVMVSTLAKVKMGNKSGVYSAFSGDDRCFVFDRQLITDNFVAGVKHDFDLLVKLSMIFVTLLLIFSFGRIEIGLTTALPMFFSWLITLGFMGLTGIKFNIFNIIISSFIFGLGVDYSILMMRGLLIEYKYGTPEIANYKVSIFISSATTIFGVIALFFARHPALNSIALISVVGIVSVVIISWTFQPLLTIALTQKRRVHHQFPITARIFIKTIITWGNIVLISIILVIIGNFMYLFLPVKRRYKEHIFHSIFCWLSRIYIFLVFPYRKFYNPHGEDFSKPAIIITNHQSLIETPAMLMLHPKIIILTRTWVYKSPVFGPIARLANFYNVENGLDNIMDKLRNKINEGYSILIFPEAHRSKDQKIQRFHRGAFYLAQQLKVDILPVMMFGTGDFLAKGDFWGKPNEFCQKAYPRVSWDDPSFGNTYQERARQFRQFYIRGYREFKTEEGNVDYYRRKLVLNYIFKGPVLEWSLRINLMLEKNYTMYDRLLPRSGEILDIGCGYGFVAYMLHMTSDERRITGIDYDKEKIRVANHCFYKNGDINFETADAMHYETGNKDGILLKDILHYLPFDEQEKLLQRCIDKLNPGGVILIREANAETIRRIALKNGLSFEIIEGRKITSNTIFLLKKTS